MIGQGMPGITQGGIRTGTGPTCCLLTKAEAQFRSGNGCEAGHFGTSSISGSQDFWPSQQKLMRGAALSIGDCWRTPSDTGESPRISPAMYREVFVTSGAELPGPIYCSPSHQEVRLPTAHAPAPC